MTISDNAKSEARERLYDILNLQREIESKFGEEGYNVFVFGSYLTTSYQKGISDIDIAIYAEDFGLYKQLAVYLEEYYDMKGIPSDIFFIDISMQAPIYCAPLKSKVQFTDYFPQKLIDFERECECRLEEVKARVAG